MAAQLELFVLPFSVYPRRVLIYLAERNILNHPVLKITPVTLPEFSAPGKPPGSVPMMRLPDGSYIKQSVAILEYFEEILARPAGKWQEELAAAAAAATAAGGMHAPSLTAEDRARTRVMMGLVDDATLSFNLGAAMGSSVFEARRELVPKGALMALENMRRNLDRLEDQFFTDYKGIGERPASTAECALIALLLHAMVFYRRDVLAGSDSAPELVGLRRFYEEFSERPSAKIGEDFYPPARAQASVWRC